MQRTGELRTEHGVKDIMQNFPGGSLGVRREVYHAIGGMDESFEGWGGEDNEFLDRLNTTNVFQGGFLPAVHLWHASRPSKGVADNPRLALLARKREQSPEERIADLLKQPANEARQPGCGSCP
jgi:GT2 family glycosyltransferase